MESYPFDDVTPEAQGAQGLGAQPDATPQTGHTASRVRKLATGAAIGVTVLATGGVAIAATHTGGTATGTTGAGTSEGTGSVANPSSSAAPSTGTHPGPGRGAPGGRGFGGPGFGGPGLGGPGGLGNALHGTFVVPATSGTGTTTEDLRTGKVTAVSATSISVTSTDKTAGTFVVNATTKVNHGESKISDVKVGNTVTVIATDADKTALSIEDRTLDPAGAPGGDHDGRPMGTPPSGAPATGETS